MAAERAAVIFDLDGVLTDTAELHFRSWKQLADELGIAFDRQRNQALRGVSRETSLAILLGEREGEFTENDKQDILRRKNEAYLAMVAEMTPEDLYPGAGALLGALQARGLRAAVASSSRNARAVIERLGIGSSLDVVVDGNDAQMSKPDPQVFLLAAQRLELPVGRCVVVEDAESGVAAARAAGMKVIGIGSVEHVGQADVVCGGIDGVSVEMVEGFLGR